VNANSQFLSTNSSCGIFTEEFFCFREIISAELEIAKDDLGQETERLSRYMLVKYEGRFGIEYSRPS
jgi:hypothetical protein